MPYLEVDRLLVEGEVVPGADGKEVRVWPSQRQVARRFGVSPSNVAAFATQHRCTERKAAYKAGKPVKPISVLDSGEPSDADAEGGGEPDVMVLPPEPRRRPGRPRKADAPVVVLEELDRLLVFGEVVQDERGATKTVYPSYRQLAERYGVTPSYIVSYVKSHNCLRRRQTAKARLALRVEDKIIEKRAEAIAVAKDDVVRMIDEFLLGFERALKEGRVRSDNPSDVNTLVRLKEFVLGGADSRQELHATLSLESIQERYARMVRQQRDTPELTGAIETTGASVDGNAKTNTSDDVRFSGERSISTGANADARSEKKHTAEDVRFSGERSIFSGADPPPPSSEIERQKPHDVEDLHDSGGENERCSILPPRN